MTRRLLGIALLVVACGDSTGTPDFSGVVPPDLASDAFVGDLSLQNIFCQPLCTAPNACCISTAGGATTAVCEPIAACPPDGIVAACTGPQDCSGATPDCCVTVNFTGDLSDGGQTTTNSASSLCTNGCAAGLDQNTFHTRLCQKVQDCVGYSGNYGGDMATTPFDACCSSPRAPTIFYCIPPSVAQSGGFDCR